MPRPRTRRAAFAAAVAALATACPPSAHAAAGAATQVLYRQPSSQVDVAEAVFVNPSPWPKPDVPPTRSVFWQRGHPDATLITPTAEDVTALTGLAVADPSQQASTRPSATEVPTITPLGTPGRKPAAAGAALDPAAPAAGAAEVEAAATAAAAAPSAPGIPWSAVQFAADGTWGAAINTTGATEWLTTTTLESPLAEACAEPWSGVAGVGSGSNDAGGALRVTYDMAVPSGFKLEPRNNSCAVYASLSVYLRTKSGVVPEQFIWYSTDVFDLERDATEDHVFVDTVSQKLIVSSHVGNAQSAYHQDLPGTAKASNSTWSESRWFGYEVRAAHVEQGIRDGLAQFPGHFPANLSTAAADYCVSGFNMELEATPGAGAGLRLANVTIEIVP